MNSNNYSIKNLLINLTKKQKLGIVAFLVLLAIVAMIFAGLVGSLQTDLSDDEEEVVENSAPVSEGVKWEDNSDGNSENVESVEVPVSTDYNENHEYTLIDYLPSSRFINMDYGNDQHGVRGYWVISENTAVEKGIVVSVDSCDVEGNTASANEYLKGLPVDLSEYTIVYETHVGDVPCDVQ